MVVLRCIRKRGKSEENQILSMRGSNYKVVYTKFYYGVPGRKQKKFFFFFFFWYNMVLLKCIREEKK